MQIDIKAWIPYIIPPIAVLIIGYVWGVDWRITITIAILSAGLPRLLSFISYLKGLTTLSVVSTIGLVVTQDYTWELHLAPFGIPFHIQKGETAVEAILFSVLLSIFLVLITKQTYTQEKNEGQEKDEPQNAQEKVQTEPISIAKSKDKPNSKVIESITVPSPQIRNFSDQDLDGYFIGRKEEQEILDQHFKEGITIQILTGFGGMGKTQLARAFVRKYGQPFDLIWWIGVDSLEQNLIDLATRLKLSDNPKVWVSG
ncbi:hypothetical protein ACQZV8_11780 [Magnetococcales bacterium HHB-1]